MISHRSSVFLLALFASACDRSATAPPAEHAAEAPVAQAASAATPAPPSASPVWTKVAPGSADVGKAAPDFTLPDLDGHPVKLSDHLGKIVVLEWFNPGCPFVNKTHTVGLLKGLAAKEMARGVVWLGINSAGPGKQGYGVDANRAGLSHFGLSHPVLLDEAGKIGHAYGAAHTPHLFVVDPKGVLVYAGAIDNSPDGEGESPSGGKLVNYVEQALDEVRAGKPVSTPRTEAYGCSVKYGAT